MRFLALPTTGGVLFLLLSAAAVGAAVMNSGLMSALLAAFLCGVASVSFVMANFSVFGLRLKRGRSENGVCGEKLQLPLTIENATPFWRMPVIVCEKLPFTKEKILVWASRAMSPRETAELAREAGAAKRGQYQLGKVILYGGDPCGLFRKRRIFSLPAEVTISPKVFQIDSLSVKYENNSVVNTEGRTLGHAGFGTEFFGVRQYRKGDEIRHVHWKSTAAKGKLMVKEFEANTVDRISIALDANRENAGQDDIESNVEMLTSAAAAIAEYLGRKYCQLSFYADVGDEIVFIEGDAASVKSKIMRTLTDIELNSNPFTDTMDYMLERLQPGSTVYLLTMSEDKIRDYAGVMEDQGILVHWLYAPKENFPPCEPDVPRVVYPGRDDGAAGAVRTELLFNTNIPEVLKSDKVYEKI